MVHQCATLSARAVSFSQGASKLNGSRASAKRPVAAAAKNAVVASARPLWLPGSNAPDYLDGSMPGDYGFDPLGLGADPENLKWFQQAELQHCRWAMLGAAGILGPELATKAGAIDVPVWFEAGEYKYFTDGYTLLFMQMALMNWAEVRRWRDMEEPGSVNEDPLFKGNVCTGTEVGYPGGKLFNPFNMAATPEQMAILKQKEIKNGRLAMVAMLGFFTQAFVTGKGPVDNYLSHLADPSHTTFFQSMGL